MSIFLSVAAGVFLAGLFIAGFYAGRQFERNEQAWRAGGDQT